MKYNPLYSEKLSIDNLNSIFTLKIRHKANPGHDKISLKNFDVDKHIEIISRKTQIGNYKFTPYKEKLISKGKGKFPRIISIPTIRDKVTLSALNEILTESFSMILDTKTSTITMQQIKAEIDSKQFDYFIKIDIKSFYDAIDHQILMKKIKKVIKDKRILELIQNAIENPTVASTSKKYTMSKKGVPQGISISNILANIFLNDFDNKFSRFKNIAYFRYVDDILILCKSNNHKRIQYSIHNELCNKLSLEINEKKDHGSLTKGFDYLGYKYTEIKEGLLGLTVKEKNLRKLEDSLIKIISTYKVDKKSEVLVWNLNLRITGFIIEKKRYGWLFFYSKLDDISILYHLDWLVNKICDDAGVKKELKLRIKKFVRAYHEITKKGEVRLYS